MDGKCWDKLSILWKSTRLSPLLLVLFATVMLYVYDLLPLLLLLFFLLFGWPDHPPNTLFCHTDLFVTVFALKSPIQHTNLRNDVNILSSKCSSSFRMATKTQHQQQRTKKQPKKKQKKEKLLHSSLQTIS